MNLIDWLLSLFRDPVAAQAFVADPERELQHAGFGSVPAAQIQQVAATVAPAAVLHGGGDPVAGLQHAVAQTHGIAFAPQRQTDLWSNNDTLSHNDTRLLSPETNTANVAGQDQQQGVGNVSLDFGDITFGNKTTNTATDGGVVNTGTAGDIDTTNVEGDGNVVGDNNDNVNTGDIETGDGSPVVIGEDNEVENSNTQAGGDIISGNDGPVVKTGDIDTSGGGAVGGDGGRGGGILTGGGGDGGNATGGAGGGVVINVPTDQSTNTGGGDVTSVDVGGDVTGGIDASTDNSIDIDDSFNTDNSTNDSFNDNSVDNSTSVDVDVTNDVGIF
ncbi:IniB N-terminal domain-containing protein [Mycolicibacterium phlei]